MKIKKVPERTCIVTHDKCVKKDLLRVVRCPDGTVKVDLTGKMNGRGAYVKKDLEVIEKARLSKVLDKHLEVNVTDDIYDEMKRVIGE